MNFDIGQRREALEQRLRSHAEIGMLRIVVAIMFAVVRGKECDFH